MELGDPEPGLSLSFWVQDTQVVSVCESPSPTSCLLEVSQGREEEAPKGVLLPLGFPSKGTPLLYQESF